MSVCVCACFFFGKQLGSRLFEFRDEQSPGYIARAADCDQQCALVFDLCRACLETEIRIEAAGPRSKKRLKTSKGRPMSAIVCV